jgi:AAA+ ATPase superfamily predicted ATPase
MNFVNRERELADLADLWQRPGAQLVVIYGRRRTGKTTLLSRFIENKPSLYWVADRFPAATLLADFSKAIYRVQHPDVSPSADFSFPDWEMAVRALGAMARTQRLAVILDEFPYAVEAEAALPSLVQRLWDHELQHTQLFLALCGSHIGMMERELMTYRAPLYGRRSGQIFVQPMAFPALRQFFPHWNAVQQVTAYAILGGIPSYWEQFEPTHTIEANIRERILHPNNVLYLEPLFLVQAELREPRNYLGILRAIAQGHHRMHDISNASGVPRLNLPRYMETLRDLHLIERRVPVTERHPERSRRGLYRLRDHYLKFYFRFVAPYREDLEQGFLDRAWQSIDQQLHSFVGTTAFEHLCRQWVRQRGREGHLPFIPDQVGSYWDRRVQVDVVGVNWGQHTVLLGEARWTSRPLGVQALDEVRAKTEAVLPEPNWYVHYALFSRSGFTRSLQHRAAREGVFLIQLADIVETLS